MGALRVEVFPLADDRWVAVIESFSTETNSPERVPAEVAASIRAVLKWDAPFTLVDDHGEPWTPALADQQLTRLADVGDPGSPVARVEGRCATCQHEWSVHPMAIVHAPHCVECDTEAEHGDRSRTERCELTPPQLQVLASRYVMPRLARDLLLRHKVQLVRSRGHVWLEASDRTWSRRKAGRMLTAAEAEVSTEPLPVVWRQWRGW